MITRADDFFAKGCGRCERFDTPDCSTRKWVEGLRVLRAICLEAGLTEAVKWAHPCYMHADRNIVIIGAFRDDFRMTFFNAALMKDPDGVLEKRCPNTQHAGMIRFTINAQPKVMGKIILSYLAEAMDYAERGLMAPKDKAEVDMPGELADALDADSELAEAFHDLTPGRQRSYVINLNSAKKSETRVSRIAKFRSRIIAGKGANEL